MLLIMRYDSRLIESEHEELKRQKRICVPSFGTGFSGATGKRFLELSRICVPSFGRSCVFLGITSYS